MSDTPPELIQHAELGARVQVRTPGAGRPENAAPSGGRGVLGPGNAGHRAPRRGMVQRGVRGRTRTPE